MAAVDQQLCTEIDELLHYGAFNAISYFNLACLTVTLTCFPVLIFICLKHRILMHPNLSLLFANILTVYFLYNFGQFVYLLRNRILLLIYKEPCDLLTPLWLVSLMYGPAYLQNIAYPALHFCVMVERVHATVLAENYEREGQQQRMVWLMLLVIWPVALGYALFVVWAAFADGKMAVQGLIYLTSARSAQLIIYVNYAVLALALITALCDWRVTVLNTRIRVQSQQKDGVFAYSLSRNFQLNENVLAMRLIWPLDTAYALLFAVYILLVIVLRSYRLVLTSIQYSNYYGLINTLMFLYATVTMLVYIRFAKFVSRCQRRDVSRRKASEPEAKIYFKQLAAQWA